MMNENVAVARTIAAGIGAMEAHADSVLEESAQLVLRTLKARRDLRQPLSFGRDAIVKLTGGMAFAAQARDQFIEAHTAFALDRDSIGVTPRAAGCHYGSIKPDRLGLTAVQTDAA